MHSHKIDAEEFNAWQKEIISNLGIDANTDKEQVLEALRRIILASSNLYSDIVRVNDGMKPLWRRRK